MTCGACGGGTRRYVGLQSSYPIKPRKHLEFAVNTNESDWRQHPDTHRRVMSVSNDNKKTSNSRQQLEDKYGLGLGGEYIEKNIDGTSIEKVVPDVEPKVQKLPVPLSKKGKKGK